jgi:hypothetical protein
MRKVRTVFYRLPIAGIVLAMAGAFAMTSGATTLRVVSGDEQIQQAAAIFRGRVVSIEAVRDISRSKGAIFSIVQFAPLATYKGIVSNPVSLRFLGGTLGDVTMRVDGMPEFQVGGEYVLFVSGGSNRACPVVGWHGGCLPVKRETAAAGAVGINADCAGWMRRSSLARTRAVMPAALDLPQFESLLRGRIAELGASK